jgi:hypothetical protein
LAKIIRTGGNSAYLDQLGRVRRWLKRLDVAVNEADEYRDRYYAFFQACWNLKDWTLKDPNVDPAKRKQISAAVHAAGSRLLICRDIANGSKHLALTDPSCGTGAGEHHLNYTIFAGQNRDSEVECLVDDGQGNQVPAKQLARDCLQQWEQVLGNAGLAI